MDNLDRFQKLVSTRWTFSISISIGLERRDPQAYNFVLINRRRFTLCQFWFIYSKMIYNYNSGLKVLKMINLMIWQI